MKVIFGALVNVNFILRRHDFILHVKDCAEYIVSLRSLTLERVLPSEFMVLAIVVRHPIMDIFMTSAISQ